MYAQEAQKCASFWLQSRIQDLYVSIRPGTYDNSAAEKDKESVN
jgi:hypothetical protein